MSAAAIAELMLALFKAGEQILADVQSGKVDAETVKQRLASITSADAAAAAAADAIVDQRFPK